MIIYLIWCDQCGDWIEQFTPHVQDNAISCLHCGNILMKVTTMKYYTVDQIKKMNKQERIKIAKAIWGLK